MDKTKVSIIAVVGALVVYAFYRNYQTAQQTGKSDQLPVQSEIEYYQSPSGTSVSDGINDKYSDHPSVSQTITNQPGKKVLYNGQPLTYPLV